jgi:hypothetical protein
MVYTTRISSRVFYAYNYGVEATSRTHRPSSFSKEGEARGDQGEPFMLQTPEMALTIFDIP